MSTVLILQNVGESPQYFAEWLHYASIRIWSVEAKRTSVSRDGAAPSFEPLFKIRQTQFLFRHWYLLDVEQLMYYKIYKCQINSYIA